MNQPTLDKLHALKLKPMAEAFQVQLDHPNLAAMPFEERFALLVDVQYSASQTAALEHRLRRANMRQSASMENLDLRTPRGLDRAIMQGLASGQWIRQNLNILLVGPTFPVKNKNRVGWAKNSGTAPTSLSSMVAKTFHSR